MSVQKVNVLVPPSIVAPPGARWIADLVAWLFGADDEAGARLTTMLEARRARIAVERQARREARARRDLVLLAKRYEATQPEFAKDLHAAARSDRQRVDAALHR